MGRPTQDKYQHRTITPYATPEEEQETSGFRPTLLKDFIGQQAMKENLEIFIQSAKKRGEPLDHILFYGPPGLGKTTLSQIISHELAVGFKGTSGPIITKAGDLAAILTNLQEGDILFIDEIHRLHTAVEEVLYSAMEDFKLDIVIGEGPAARSIKIDLPKFTLVAATTRLGLLANPLRDRFGIPLKLEFYQPDELRSIIERGAKILKTEIAPEASIKLAQCSRGTPRIALRLLKRIHDFAVVANRTAIDEEIVSSSLERLGVDRLGLDRSDHRYLNFIADFYHGGPVGIETIVAGLGEERDAIEDTIEPFLIQQGLLNKTARGRILTATALEHIGYKLPDTPNTLF